MEAIIHITELLQNTYVPWTVITAVTILFTAMFAIVSSVLTLLINIASEQGMFLHKPKPNNSPKPNQPNQNQDPNEPSTGNQPSGTQNQSDAATHTDKPLNQPRKPKIGKPRRDLHADLWRMLNLLLRTNKLNIAVVVAMVGLLVTQLSLGTLEVILKYWGGTSVKQATQQAVELALKNCICPGDNARHMPVEKGAAPVPFGALP